MKTKQIIASVVFSTGILGLFSCGAPHATTETYMGKEVLDIPGNYTLNEVVNHVEDTLARRATNIQKFVGFMPEELPDKPGHPQYQMRDWGNGLVNITYATIECGPKAVATVSGQEPELGTTLGQNYSGYKACIYPYKGGYRVYIVATYMYTSQNGIANLINKATESLVNNIACNGMKKFDCWFNQIVEESKKEFPDAKILEVVYPQGGKKETKGENS